MSTDRQPTITERFDDVLAKLKDPRNDGFLNAAAAYIIDSQKAQITNLVVRHELATARAEQAETDLSSLREAADKALDWLIIHPNARGLSEAKTILAALLAPSPADRKD